MSRCTTSTKFTRPTMANITGPERLVVARRRASLTQEGLRAKLKMTRRQYQRIESGRMSPESWEAMLAENRAIRALVESIEDLEAWERCFLSRERSGMTLKELAKKVKRSKVWVGEMEHGRARPDVLVDFWAGRN
mgnify:CR=1 FL=1